MHAFAATLHYSLQWAGQKTPAICRLHTVAFITQYHNATMQCVCLILRSLGVYRVPQCCHLLPAKHKKPKRPCTPPHSITPLMQILRCDPTHAVVHATYVQSVCQRHTAFSINAWPRIHTGSADSGGCQGTPTGNFGDCFTVVGSWWWGLRRALHPGKYNISTIPYQCFFLQSQPWVQNFALD